MKFHHSFGLKRRVTNNGYTGSMGIAIDLGLHTVTVPEPRHLYCMADDVVYTIFYIQISFICLQYW